MPLNKSSELMTATIILSCFAVAFASTWIFVGSQYRTIEKEIVKDSGISASFEEIESAISKSLDNDQEAIFGGLCAGDSVEDWTRGASLYIGGKEETVHACLLGVFARLVAGGLNGSTLQSMAVGSSDYGVRDLRRPFAQWGVFSEGAANGTSGLKIIGNAFNTDLSGFDEDVASKLSEIFQNTGAGSAKRVKELIRGPAQSFIVGLLLSIIVLRIVVGRKNLSESRKYIIGWLIDSATVAGLIGTVHGLILALRELEVLSAGDGISGGAAALIGGMALAFSTTVMGLITERIGSALYPR